MRRKLKVIAKVKIKGKMTCLQVANALTNYALLKRYIKKLDPELRTINTVSSAKTVIKTITTTCTVSFANRFIPTIAKIKMMISGLAAITVKGG